MVKVEVGWVRGERGKVVEKVNWRELEKIRNYEREIEKAINIELLPRIEDDRLETWNLVGVMDFVVSNEKK